jgi:hypothetical protein
MPYQEIEYEEDTSPQNIKTNQKIYRIKNYGVVIDDFIDWMQGKIKSGVKVDDVSTQVAVRGCDEWQAFDETFQDGTVQRTIFIKVP